MDGALGSPVRLAAVGKETTPLGQRTVRALVPVLRAVELPWVAFHRFDAHDKLVSERIVMDLGTLGAEPTQRGD